MKKLKDIINCLIILAYIFMIGSLFVENDYFTFNNWGLLILNVVLLSIGFYSFIQINKDK